MKKPESKPEKKQYTIVINKNAYDRIKAFCEKNNLKIGGYISDLILVTLDKK
jgi:hypothetical protein